MLWFLTKWLLIFVFFCSSQAYTHVPPVIHGAWNGVSTLTHE